MNGEFDRLLGWVAELGLRGLAGAFLIALPVAAAALIWWMHRLPHLRGYWRLPVVTWPSAAAGVILGWSILYADPYGPSYRIASIFAVDGPWDISWTRFLRYRADPALYDFAPLLAVLRNPDTDPRLALVLLVAGVLLVIAVVGALACLRGLDLPVGLLGIGFLSLASLAMTIYVTALLAYSFNTLNFWAAAVALVILQYFRRMAARGGH